MEVKLVYPKTSLVFIFIIFILSMLFYSYLDQASTKPNSAKVDNNALETVIINEAVRTILYIPLYHAKVGGFFEEQGLNVEIITGGTATSSFTSMLNGEADFSQADPMYVPISSEQGANTSVVAQVVARIAVWGLTNEPNVNQLSREALLGKVISTQPRPMTAYTYAKNYVDRVGLSENEVSILEVRPPNEITPLLQGQSNFAFTLEPNTTIAESQGARIVHSFAEEFGEQIFTGLMARDDYIENNRSTVLKVLIAYQKSLADILENPNNVLASAKEFLPGLDDQIIITALERLVNEKIIPDSIIPSEESWSKAMQVRIDVGDLKSKSSLSESFSIELAEEAVRNGI